MSILANCQGNLTKCWGGGGGGVYLRYKQSISSMATELSNILVALCYENREKLGYLWVTRLVITWSFC